MRVTFSRSGGVAGVTLRCSLDTDAMEPEEAQRFEALVEASGLRSMAPTLPVPETDRFQYLLDVAWSPREANVYVFGESQVPARLRPLLDRLTDEARSRR